MSFCRAFEQAALAVLLAAAITVCVPGANVLANNGDKWTPWFELGGFYNSDDASRGEFMVFVPLMQSSSTLLFLDGRGKLFEDDVQVGNLALGYRQMTSSGFNLGAWIGGDVRSTTLNNTFWQLSGGFEALSHNYDARVNWYGPITKPKAGGEGFTEVVLQGNNILMIGSEEVGLYGFDGELGMRVPLEMAGINAYDLDLRVYGGGFYFNHEDALKEIAGGKARVELRFNDIIEQMPGSSLTAEYKFSYDDVREERHEVGVRLRIPFDGERVQVASLSAQELRMMDRLERDTDIVTTQSGGENVEDALTNTDFDRVAFVNNGGSITTESAAAGDNSLLIVNGTVNDGTQTVQANQTVQGGGSTIQVRGRSSGIVVGFTAPGSMPTVINTGAGETLSLTGDNTHIAGLLIDGNNIGGHGIDGGSDKTNIAITQNMIQNTSDAGVYFGLGNSNVTVSGNTISNTSSDGVGFDDGNSNVTVSGNTISNVDYNAVAFRDSNSNVTVSGNTISNTGVDGMWFRNNNINLTLSGNTFTDIGDGDATDHVFDFVGGGNTLLTGSTGNVVTTAPNTGNLCNGVANFTGSLQVTDLNGVSHTFVGGTNCP